MDFSNPMELDELNKAGYLITYNATLDPAIKIQIFNSIKKDEFKFAVINALSDDASKLVYLREDITAFSTRFLVKLIGSLSNENLKKEYLNKHISKFKSSQIKDVIITFKNDDLKMKYIQDDEIDLNLYDKLLIISSFENEELATNYIKSPVANFGKIGRLLTLCSLKDEEGFKKYGIHLDDSHKKTLKIPSNMTIGIELEAEGQKARYLKTTRKIFGRWTAKAEPTLREGVEVVSPILKNTEEDMYSIAMVCEIMKAFDLRVNERCGGHIHFGADFLGNDIKAWENFYRIYSECEEIVYKMSNKKNELPREGTLIYAKQTNEILDVLYPKGEVKLESQECFEKLIKVLQITRHRGVNVMNLGKEGKNTVEFRIPNGSLDPNVIKENITLYGSLLRVAKEMSLNPEYKKEEFEILKEKDLSEAEKTEALLNMLFDDEKEKRIYRERWEAIKEYAIFDELQSDEPKFKRGDYSMREEVEAIYREISSEERAQLLEIIKRKTLHDTKEKPDKEEITQDNNDNEQKVIE